MSDDDYSLARRAKIERQQSPDAEVSSVPTASHARAPGGERTGSVSMKGFLLRGSFWAPKPFR